MNMGGPSRSGAVLPLTASPFWLTRCVQSKGRIAAAPAGSTPSAAASAVPFTGLSVTAHRWHLAESLQQEGLFQVKVLRGGR